MIPLFNHRELQRRPLSTTALSILNNKPATPVASSIPFLSHPLHTYSPQGAQNVLRQHPPRRRPRRMQELVPTRRCKIHAPARTPQVAQTGDVWLLELQQDVVGRPGGDV
jgi:hypothetical protein